MIEIDRWAKSEAPLLSHIEDLQRKFEMQVLNRYYLSAPGTKNLLHFMSHLMDLSNCTLCPRECGVNRVAGELGYCGIPAEIRAARAALMYYEEPCISGAAGSGAIFFTGCNLGCRFCQNIAISKGLIHSSESANAISYTEGLPLDSGKLCDVMLHLQDQRASNINLVTPSHVLPVLIPDRKSHV